jgi:hypothetical protein
VDGADALLELPLPEVDGIDELLVLAEPVVPDPIAVPGGQSSVMPPATAPLDDPAPLEPELGACWADATATMAARPSTSPNITDFIDHPFLPRRAGWRQMPPRATHQRTRYAGAKRIPVVRRGTPSHSREVAGAWTAFT